MNFKVSLKKFLDSKIVNIILITIILASVVFILLEMFLPQSNKFIPIINIFNRYFLYTFIAEFILRIIAAFTDPKGIKSYVGTFNFWIDVVTILPLFRPFRVLRIFRVLKLFNINGLNHQLFAFVETIKNFFYANNIQLVFFIGIIATATITTAIIFEYYHPNTPFISAIWWAIIRIVDSGYVETDGVSGLGLSLLSFSITIVGLVLFGLFISVTATLFQDYLKNIPYKKLKLKVEDHTLICNVGENEMMVELIKEFSQHHEKVAILTENSKKVTEKFSFLNYYIREGSPTQTKHLIERGNVVNAKNIIVLRDYSNEDNINNNDSRTLLTVMIIANLVGENKCKKIKNIIIEVDNKEQKELLVRLIDKKEEDIGKTFDKDLFKILYKRELIARLLTQSSIDIYYQQIYSELFTHKGQEITIATSDGIHKKDCSFVDLQKELLIRENYTKIIKTIDNTPPLLIGTVSNNNINFLPDNSVNDKLIFIANTTTQAGSKGKEKTVVKKHNKGLFNRKREKLLILGWSKTVDKIIEEAVCYDYKNFYILSDFIPTQDKVIVTKKIDQNIEDIELNNQLIEDFNKESIGDIKNNISTVNYIKGDHTDKESVEKIYNAISPDSVIIVAHQSSKEEIKNSDAKTIKTLFILDGIKGIKNTLITAELLEEQNQEHGFNAGADSIILTPVTISNFISQLVRDVSMKSISDQLLTTYGKEIYTVPLCKLINCETDKISFLELINKRAESHGVIDIIGWIIHSNNNKDIVELNPADRHEKIQTSKIKRLVVISEKQDIENVNNYQNLQKCEF